jgi:uncharacterized protein involved in exopolysaccharide biosynthesis
MQDFENSNAAGIPEDEAFSLKAEGIKLYNAIVYALTHWRLLTVAAIAGALLGLGYWYWKPIAYTARISFVVEDAKSSGGGLMSALAGQFGLDLGNMAGGSGVLSGDNILQLLKSQSMVRKTLLSAVDSSSKRSLADVYAETYGLKEKWKNSSKVNREIDFPAGQKSFARIEDSLLQRMEERILEKELSVNKIDRKLSFIELQTTMRNETLSIAFCEHLLKVATDFYVETKTRRLTKNIQRLQAKADSLEYALNRKTYSAANANRMLLDANPVYAEPEVSAEISARDKFVQSTIYAEIIKNLEMNKTAQIQETPTVQIVDTPQLPLNTNRVKIAVAIISGAVIGIFICGFAIIALAGSRRRKAAIYTA